MRIRDEEGHRAMQAAGKAWRAIKITSMRTWTDWTQVVGPGLTKARKEALSVSGSFEQFVGRNDRMPLPSAVLRKVQMDI